MTGLINASWARRAEGFASALAIISAARDPERFAHLGQIILGLLAWHELEAA